jgi:DNA-directed RNA polymerase subunit D|tara:strand:+ start:135 stop:935 length:801 start_codon:yes stop_codon:yes gene_type:complete
MEIRSLENDKEKGKLSFILKDTTPAYANALRRAMVEEVPTMAIEDVEFRKNSSILYDEIVAHRLGLMPLTTDLKSYNLPEKCKCKGKGCARCQLKLTLKVKGPCTAYASDIKTKDSAVKPVHTKTPIVKLLKVQSLELEATAVLGKGKTHMKWSPGNIHYKQKAIIEINDKCDGCGKCISACPVNVLELKDNRAAIIKDNHLNCHLCNACQDICPVDSIKISPSNDFIFYVESWGQLDCKKIVVEAIKILQEELTEFSEDVKNSGS